MSKRFFFAAWIYMLMAFLPKFGFAADELMGEFLFRQHYIASDGRSVANPLVARLWRKDDNEHFVIQFTNGYYPDEYCWVQFFDDTLMYFEKDNKIYTFTSLLDCDGQIKAAGMIWGADGLWQLQQLNP